MLTLILVSIGILLIFDVSASTSLDRLFTDDPYYIIKHQLLMVMFGSIALGIATLIPIDIYQKMPRLIYFIGLGLLLLPLLWGEDSHGAHRWINIFGFSLQTSEFAKFCFIIFFAHLTQHTHDEIKFLLWLVPPALLLLLQKDFGTLMIIGVTAGVTYFLSGASMVQVTKVAALSLIGGIVLMMSSGYRRERLGMYWQQFTSKQEQETVDDYHVRQLQYAIGRGRLFGQGIGQSRQKFPYLPEVHTDSIFAILAEETGIVGVLIMFLIYLCFLSTIIWINLSPVLSKEQQLIGFGIFISLVSQIFVNLAAISGVTPLTGITLPFLSYGGSSLVVTMFFTGVIVNLAMIEDQRPTYKIIRRKYV